MSDPEGSPEIETESTTLPDPLSPNRPEIVTSPLRPVSQEEGEPESPRRTTEESELLEEDAATMSTPKAFDPDSDNPKSFAATVRLLFMNKTWKESLTDETKKKEFAMILLDAAPCAPILKEIAENASKTAEDLLKKFVELTAKELELFREPSGDELVETMKTKLRTLKEMCHAPDFDALATISTGTSSVKKWHAGAYEVQQKFEKIPPNDRPREKDVLRDLMSAMPTSVYSLLPSGGTSCTTLKELLKALDEIDAFALRETVEREKLKEQQMRARLTEEFTQKNAALVRQIREATPSRETKKETTSVVQKTQSETQKRETQRDASEPDPKKFVPMTITEDMAKLSRDWAEYDRAWAAFLKRGEPASVDNPMPLAPGVPMDGADCYRCGKTSFNKQHAEVCRSTTHKHVNPVEQAMRRRNGFQRAAGKGGRAFLAFDELAYQNEWIEQGKE